MAAQQVVIHVSGGTNTFNVLPLPDPAELGPQVTEEAERATATAFFSTLAALVREEARRGRISEEGLRVLNVHVVPSAEGEEQDAAVKLAESCREWGDAIQSVLNANAEDEAVNEFVDATEEGDLNTAFQKFKDMAQRVLECDSDGIGTGYNIYNYISFHIHMGGAAFITLTSTVAFLCCANSQLGASAWVECLCSLCSEQYYVSGSS